MVVIKSNVMYSCEAFFIGSSEPIAGKRGVEALQDPLKERYKHRPDVSSVEGYEVVVSVMPDMVHIQYKNDAEPSFTLPINYLVICAAVRCVESATESSNMKFVPVHSVVSENEPDSSHPAVFSTIMRKNADSNPECFAFICADTRDALHLVNATQTAHTALKRGYSASGTMKFFLDQSTAFDRSLNINRSQTKTEETRKVYSYKETNGSQRVTSTDSKTYHIHTDYSDAGQRTERSDRTERVEKLTNGDVETSNTYYVRADDVQIPSTSRSAEARETIVVGLDVEEDTRPKPAPAQQTIIVEKPIIKKAPPIEIPEPQIIEKPVYIDPPQPPKIEPQVIVVDKPVFKPFQKWEDPPKPIVKENPVYIDPPLPPQQEPQTIIVDKPIIKPFAKPPTPPPPIIQENPIYIDPPAYQIPEPQRIIVDKPIIRPPGPPPPAPEPIVEEKPVYIDAPEYPPQVPHKVVVEKPVFNPPKPAPRPPTPIIEEKKIFIDPPAYPTQQPQRIIVEKPIIRDPGPPPPAPKPEIIEKPVYINPPTYPQQEPQRIIVEKPVLRDPGPPPPPPQPIIIEKIVYIDPPPWPKQEPQKIIVEKPVIRQREAPPPPKPIIVEKPVYIDAPEPPPPQPQRIVVEKPVLRTTTYGDFRRRDPSSAYSYTQYISRPADDPRRGSYIVRSGPPPPPQGLRRYAYSESGDERPGNYRWDQRSDAGGYTSRARLYGQPRDFRQAQNQFMNERGFTRRIANEEFRQPRRVGDTYGAAYRINNTRRDSVSS